MSVQLKMPVVEGTVWQVSEGCDEPYEVHVVKFNKKSITTLYVEKDKSGRVCYWNTTTHYFSKTDMMFYHLKTEAWRQVVSWKRMHVSQAKAFLLGHEKSLATATKLALNGQK